jgi:hypothetical protein
VILKDTKIMRGSRHLLGIFGAILVVCCLSLYGARAGAQGIAQTQQATTGRTTVAGQIIPPRVIVHHYGGGDGRRDTHFGMWPNGFGGYEFGSYSPCSDGAYTVPSAYSLYTGISGYVYIDDGNVQYIMPVNNLSPYYAASGYSNSGNTVNEYNYTVNNYCTPDTSSTAPDQTSGDNGHAQALPAPHPAAGDYNPVFTDIQQAWLTDDSSLIGKHLPAPGGSLVVSIGSQDSYSIESSHFAQITQDALSKLTTYGFILTYVKVQGDGSVTGYFTQTYAPVAQTDGARSTMYLSFSLTSSNGTWVIAAINSSSTPLIGPGGSQIPSAPPATTLTGNSAVR